MNYEDRLLHLYTEQMMGGISVATPVGVVQGTDQIIPHEAELAEVSKEGNSEQRQLEIAELFIRELKALDSISRKSQCRTLIGRIDYRIDKLKRLAIELRDMFAQDDPELQQIQNQNII